MIYRTILSLSLLLFIGACQSTGDDSTTDTPSAQAIVDSAIAYHGGSRFEQMDLSFDFRGKHFEVHHDNGQFKYVRSFENNSGHTIQDVLTNDGFFRIRNGDTLSDMDQKTRNAAYSATNSVVYFALLPYGLNDAAVNKNYLGTTELEGNTYHKVRVTFDEQEGGKDHHDIFLYWFNKNNYRLDYLAYQFFTDGGGYRFRRAYNRHQAGNLLLNDYINYEPRAGEIPFTSIDSLFAAGELKEVSRIDLENVSLQ